MQYRQVPILALFSDDFESGTGNWTISTRWQAAVTYAHSGTYSLISNDPVSLQCATCSDDKSCVYSDRTATPFFSFWTRYAIESGYDGGIIYGSSNGVVWTKLTPTPAYPGTVNGTQACLGSSGSPAFSGLNSTWTRYAVDLTSYAGGDFYPRFTYGTDASVSNGGWFIDDVRVDYGSSCSLASSPGAVQNNLHIVKSGTDLTLTWTAPGGACMTSDYGVYRGSLPWTGYNHSYYTCSTGGSTFGDYWSRCG